MNLRFRTDHSKENNIFETTAQTSKFAENLIAAYLIIHSIAWVAASWELSGDQIRRSDCSGRFILKGAGNFLRSQTLDRYYRPINVSKQFPVCTNKSAKNPVSLSFWISLSELGVLQSKNRMISAFRSMRFVMTFNWLVRCFCYLEGAWFARNAGIAWLESR